MSNPNKQEPKESLWSFNNAAMTLVVLLIIFSWLSFLSVVIFG
ncbi:hypothetical protein SAMN05216526_0900 [Ectothiorhodosinus mongolicus]|uniref:Uncharacterized protein n=1 Tax=Ectothiorhodosinus mongolicus TaxID=233100 RepID=A0A1R3VUQ2_9GAMM|nr:hypothetical protein [Ectothiorhodosinus mongolicus]SIT68641.1 hypothetical protein SAMN05216526_0900 [Ectothiorhodosinus mongolicus]